MVEIPRWRPRMGEAGRRRTVKLGGPKKPRREEIDEHEMTQLLSEVGVGIV